MEVGLLIIFWYGVLHAFGPDHLTAIANFSIGKQPKQAMFITLFFALGHGVMLFVFSKVLQYYVVPESITAYGDSVAASVIISIGAYLLYMVYADKIHLRRHEHEGREHIHIYFSHKHEHHSGRNTVSAYTIGMLMGVGGVRSMLVTLGMLEAGRVDLSIVLVFVAGVSLSFAIFGVIVSFINKNMLMSQKQVRRMFTGLAIVSLFVGTNTLLG